MKAWVRNLFLLPVLMAGVGLMQTGRVTAQTFKSLYSFTPPSPSYPYTNSDGVNPFEGVVLSGNTLYGTAQGGGVWGSGTLFAVHTDGTGFTNFHSFGELSSFDGYNPSGTLVLSGDSLYGTTSGGGTSFGGMLFRINTDGTAYSSVSSLDGSGTDPEGTLFLSGATFYGTMAQDGGAGSGTIFEVNTNGTGFTTLYTFNGASRDNGGYYTNSDGVSPRAGLVLSGTNLYGTASYGGTTGFGTVFSVSTNGTAFKALHTFTAPPLSQFTNSDGADPETGLVLADNVIYGTAYIGGSWDYGTIFRINTDGSGFTNLHTFTGYPADGAYPNTLILSGQKLYGTTQEGGNSSFGTVFSINIDGTGYNTLHSFPPGGTDPSLNIYTNSEGFLPMSPLLSSGSTLYGTTRRGGLLGYGTVFSLSLPVGQPSLTIIPSGTNAILTWPTNYVGFTLQSTTNLVSLLWNTNYPAPVVVNGRYAVTNPISGTHQFYRLSQ